jgi:DNA-binding SARP family transcriptional activator
LPSTGEKVAVAARVVPNVGEAVVLLQIRAMQEPASSANGVNGSTPTIMFRTLGDTVLESPDGDVRGGWLDRRTGRLLKYLAANRTSSVHADMIAEALWPHGRTDSTNKVRHYVHELRERLEPGRDRYARSTFIVARNGGYQLNLDRVHVDAEEFERKAREGLSELARGDRERAVESLEAAMALYRGDFLPNEPYEDWAIAERERLFDLAGQALRALASALTDPAQATVYLERLAEMEPLDPDVQRDLISAWLRQGKRTRAIRRYRTLQSRLMREFGEPVAFDLAELARSERAT